MYNKYIRTYKVLSKIENTSLNIVIVVLRVRLNENSHIEVKLNI